MEIIVVSLSIPLLRLRMTQPSLSSASASSSSSPRLLIKSSSSTIGNHSSPTRPRSLLLSPARASASASWATTAATRAGQKEKDLVFVAGATGRVGSRAVRELIKLGFRVRAAVRNAQRATSLLQSVQQLKLDGDGDDAATTETQLELVECDLETQAQDGIVSAIGNASLVVCSIGASEKEILDVTGPYRIDYMATTKLVHAASAAKVDHFVLVTSLGTNKIGFPAFLLNLFWGVLYWKRRAEEALIASGIPYTIIRPGGMERPTDAYKETHNLVVAAEDTYVGGQVSNLQVAELIGCIATNRTTAAYCKILEVVAETTAPLLPMEQLLSTIPSKRAPAPAPADDDEQPPPPQEETEGSAELKKPSDQPPAPAGSSEAAALERPSLSPYTAFVDLKPPSSPSPTPPPPSSSS